MHFCLTSDGTVFWWHRLPGYGYLHLISLEPLELNLTFQLNNRLENYRAQTLACDVSFNDLLGHFHNDLS